MRRVQPETTSFSGKAKTAAEAMQNMSLCFPVLWYPPF